MANSISLVGLDVHAAQTHAAVLDLLTGELRRRRLNVPPGEVVGFLASLPGSVRAVYEAGSTGFGLARAGRELGIDVRVVAPGKIPRAPGDRVKTDKRDAERLVRLLAAGELHFAFVPTVADEQFRDLIRAIEDVRGDLMRARHRLSKMLLRREVRWNGPGSAWTITHMRWLRSLRFDDVCSQATLLDYLSSVEMLLARRQTRRQDRPQHHLPEHPIKHHAANPEPTRVECRSKPGHPRTRPDPQPRPRTPSGATEVTPTTRLPSRRLTRPPGQVSDREPRIRARGVRTRVPVATSMQVVAPSP
jgi:transposase